MNINATKFSFNIDRNKFDKLEARANKWQKANGEMVDELNVRLEFVPAKNGPKLIKRGERSTSFKIGFIAEPTTKEEREAGKQGMILGDAIMFEPNGPDERPQTNEDEALTSEIPF